MKLIITLIFTISFFSLGCGVKRTVEVTGDIITETVEVSDCSKLLIKNIYLANETGILPKVKIFPSSERKVVICANESLAKEIKVKKSGEYLNITADNNSRYNTEFLILEIYGFTFERIRLSSFDATIESGTIDKKARLDFSSACKVNIVSYDFDDLELYISGASTVNVKSMIGKDAEVTVSGASTLKISNVILEDCDVKCSGASRLELTGNIVDLDLSLSGASTCDSKRLIANDCDLECSGASNVKIGFTNSLNGEISGASKVVYYGPKENVHFEVSGGSSHEQGKD